VIEQLSSVTSSDSNATEITGGARRTQQSVLAKARERLSSVATNFTPKRLGRQKTIKKVEEATEKVYNLPLGRQDQELLRQAKTKFEDAVQTMGENIGIQPEQQQCWAEDLTATQYCAGPALDRLSMRILTVISELEQARPTASATCQQIRQAWHELCMVCCHVVDVLDGGNRAGRRHSAPPPSTACVTTAVVSAGNQECPPSLCEDSEVCKQESGVGAWTTTKLFDEAGAGLEVPPEGRTCTSSCGIEKELARSTILTL